MRLLILILVLPVVILDYIMLCAVVFLCAWIFTSASTAALLALGIGIPVGTILRMREARRSPRRLEVFVGRNFFAICHQRYRENGSDESGAVDHAVDQLKREKPEFADWLSLEVSSIKEHSAASERGYLIKCATKCLMTKVVLELPHLPETFPDRVMQINSMVDTWWATAETAPTQRDS